MAAKRLVSVLLAIVLCMVFPVVGHAADEQAGQFEEYRQQLEELYNISITYDYAEDGSASINIGTLNILNSAFSTVTPQVVRQVSTYYEKRNGQKLKVAFMYSPYHELDANVEVLASFQVDKSLLEVYIPSTSANTFTTGAGPLTILHEFAHAYYFMFAAYYGQEKMESEWVAMNGGVKYNEGFLAYAYNKVTFMSSYGATSLEEDFAEIFSHAFIRNRDGMGFYHRLKNGDRKTALGQKVAYIENMLPMYLSDTNGAVANLRRVHTAAIYTYYQGVQLGGDYMQFAGFSQPKYVLNGLLAAYELTAESKYWIRDIGGWYVIAYDNQKYLIFPGGYAMKLTTALTVE